MRKQCLYCAIKHLAQAVILMDEANNGYQLHKWLAIGHMAEAESECQDYGTTIRAARLLYQDGEDINLMFIIEELDAEIRRMDQEDTDESQAEERKL